MTDWPQEAAPYRSSVARRPRVMPVCGCFGEYMDVVLICIGIALMLGACFLIAAMAIGSRVSARRVMKHVSVAAEEAGVETELARRLHAAAMKQMEDVLPRMQAAARPMRVGTATLAAVLAATGACAILTAADRRDAALVAAATAVIGAVICVLCYRWHCRVVLAFAAEAGVDLGGGEGGRGPFRPIGPTE